MWSWLRGHPWQADGLLALVLFALSAQQAIVGPPQVVAAGRLVTALLAATVVLRRRWPVAAFAAAAAIGAAQLAFGLQTGAPPPVAALQPTMTDLAIPVLLYTLAAYRPRRISIPGLVLCLVGSGVAITRWAPAGTAPPGGVVAAAAGLGRRGPDRLGARRLGGLPLPARVLRRASRSARPGWKLSAMRRRGSPPRPSGPANCRNDGPARLTSRRPGCAGSSVICTTGPRSGSPPWR